MEAKDQIRKFREFIEQHMLENMMEHFRSGKFWLDIDFVSLSMFEPELADNLLENPEDVIKAAELAIAEFDFENAQKFKVRFHNLLDSQKIMVRHIRSEHIGKFYSMEGIVRQKSDVRPQVTSAKFECPTCGNVINVLQLDQSFREPSRCSCGRKGKFNLVGKELVDAQGLVLEESPESLEGGEQPKRMNVFLKDDLVSPLSERRTNPGSKIKVIGYVKETPIIQRSGVRSVKFDLYIEANNVIPIEETFIQVEVSPEEEKEIIELSHDKGVVDKLANSIAPSIFGFEKIKQALVLQMLGGVQKTRSDGVVSRGDMHILLVGDPGAAKSAILKAVSRISPKARYISGKGISAAGLTASVVKDEFLRGWSLEAGAMVLASDGLCCIDEMDKMGVEDTAAMHEALENQSYHPDFEIMFSDGSVEKIGEFVDDLIENNKSGVIKGKDCEILPVSDVELLTTDLNKIFPIKAKCVSRHKAPDYFIKITYSSGRSITVTPEHPVFVFGDKIEEIPAGLVKEGQLAPAPRSLPTKNTESRLNEVEFSHFNNKELFFPEYLTPDLTRIIGYVTTEGHSHYSQKNRYAEIGVSNTDLSIISDVNYLFRDTFDAYPNIRTITNRPTKELMIIRMCSIPFYNYFKSNFNGSINGARNKYVNNTIRTSPHKIEFLRSAFKGDGFIDSGSVGFSTSSPSLAKGYQDLLLQLGILSRINLEDRKGKVYYKTSVSGPSSLEKFAELIVEFDDERIGRIASFCEKSKSKLNERDVIPNKVIAELNRLLKSFHLSDGYFYNNIKRGFNAHREVVQKYLSRLDKKIGEAEKVLDDDARAIRLAALDAREIAGLLKVSISSVYYIESNKTHRDYANLLSAAKDLAKKKVESAKSISKKIRILLDSEIRFLYIKKVEKIKNNGEKWVYDVTVEPTRTFISEGLVLHNTVSISKANIQATLIARTTVLAAANPQYGRFDPFKMIADQINLPPTLINRFDLIFPIKDIPNKERDEKLTTHILSLHQRPDSVKPLIESNILRKYIAYAKQKLKPELSDEAIEEIKAYYLKMRATGSEEGALPVIPISARQLEALVRLSEASARARLSVKVLRQDAQCAVDLLHYSLNQVGLDPETGKIDIDRIATGVSASQRNNIFIIKDIISELEGKIGKTIPIDDVIQEARIKGISGEKVDEVIEKLKRSGDIFEPRKGFLQKI
ncbi:MAG TPA: LAGLIDADG family homing endonuclease [Candidatus Nanoarchaeia archaeon]|nr:LAGLIDADG family homing endonuclease [Candidatus Nanoarchaeia archaeon]